MRSYGKGYTVGVYSLSCCCVFTYAWQAQYGTVEYGTQKQTRGSRSRVTVRYGTVQYNTA